MNFKDLSGTKVNIGDFIIQSKSLGRSPGLSYSLVVGVYTKTCNYGLRDPYPKLKVIGMNSWGDAPQSKVTTLEFQDRVLKISQNQIPKNIKKQLIGKYKKLTTNNHKEL